MEKYRKIWRPTHMPKLGYLKVSIMLDLGHFLLARLIKCNFLLSICKCKIQIAGSSRMGGSL